MIANSSAAFNPIRDYYESKVIKSPPEEVSIKYRSAAQDQTFVIQLSSDVLFAFDRYDLKKEAEPALNRAAGYIRSKPGWRIFVEGHTDNIGKPQYNVDLSRQRAETVAQWLISRGVAKADSVETKGWGLSRPAGSNASEAGRAKNRRVEIVLSK